MGWFKITVEFVLQVTQLNPFPNSWGYGDAQKPFQISPTEIPLISEVGTCPGIQCSAPKPFVCSYPELEAKGWKSCNTESSRSCWLRDETASQPLFSQYDVRTNYEKDMPPGIIREYWIEVNENPALQPDGVQKILGNYFNGTYPGPTIEACWGDTLVIHVTNRISTNGTTVHWHGIRQLNSNDMDGVNGITQCPITQDDTFTYIFNATQYGHTWYHSHYSLQYPDGAAAPLVIHGPTSDDWDIDLGPILVTDWVHDTSYVAYQAEMFGAGPASDSILVNGTGHYTNKTTGVTTGSYHQTCFTPGKKHLLKLINGGVDMDFIFSIDNHTIKVVANDLVPIEPFVVDQLFIGIGQRYSVIVEAKNDTDGDFWMRTTPATNCGNFGTNTPDDRTAVVKYNGASNTCPTTQPDNPINTTCADVEPSKLNPIVPWLVDFHPQNNVTNDTFRVFHQNETDLELGPNGAPYKHWVLGPQPMWLDFSNPTILNIEESIGNPNYTVIQEDYDRGFVYLIIDASIVPQVNHPIHLHGSDFVILAQSTEAWNETASPRLFNYDNPPRRDVAMLPAGGFLAMAFKPDNPGSWLVPHCPLCCAPRMTCFLTDQIGLYIAT
ncbi:Cupredoxin [Pseudomassariella vexata]|uniref:Cupredoxin n=1 Tax=Pseudomassariella vexata TaxID=1141098 RepID=A0A1Y2DP97_9PEZI|nr:Cupredoxin [Pseudomassariella vexata]ORY60974.1 Cupredoxin [Pseudomassariella vexata]